MHLATRRSNDVANIYEAVLCVYIRVYTSPYRPYRAPLSWPARQLARARVCGCDFNLARLTLKVEATAGTNGKGREKREEKTREKNEIWWKIAYRDMYFPVKNPRRYCFLRNIIFREDERLR